MDRPPRGVTLSSMLREAPRDHHPLRLVIVGGGVAAVEALVGLQDMAPGLLDIVVVSDRPELVYRPLGVGEPFGVSTAKRYSLRRICADLGADLICDRVAEVRASERRVVCAAGRELGYDVLLVCPGARPVPRHEHAVTFDRETRPEDFEDVLQDLRAGLTPTIAIVVPEARSWTLPAYELALLTKAWGDEQRAEGVRVVVVTPERSPLAVFGKAASQDLATLLEEEGIDVICDATPTVVSPRVVDTGPQILEADRVVSLPHLVGPALPGLPHDAAGFIEVDRWGRVAGLEHVYAAGDGTTFPIKQGGLAAQQADRAAILIAGRAGADPGREPPSPVLRGLLPSRRGRRFLRVELDHPMTTSMLSDQPLWWPPSKVASRWLSPYLRRLDNEDEEHELPRGRLSTARVA